MPIPKLRNRIHPNSCSITHQTTNLVRLNPNRKIKSKVINDDAYRLSNFSTKATQMHTPSHSKSTPIRSTVHGKIRLNPNQFLNKLLTKRKKKQKKREGKGNYLVPATTASSDLRGHEDNESTLQTRYWRD